jgi:hypothetical protein
MLFGSPERLTTGNSTVCSATRCKTRPLYQNRRPKIFYGTQVGATAHVVLFC